MGKKKGMFTVEQVQSIMYEDGVFDKDDNMLFRTVDEDIVGTDQEKGSSKIEYVIEELATGKFYKATLGKSPWYKQDEHNAEQPWVEVKAKKTTKTVYK